VVPDAVRFDEYGGRDLLYLAEVDRPRPGAGEGLVAVKAAGINPGGASIREGKLAEQFPAEFPSGQGSDFAGVTAAVAVEAAGASQGDTVVVSAAASEVGSIACSCCGCAARQ
jgi:NADPH:quinone reductase-like Zn-dependent oxidoreductase